MKKWKYKYITMNGPLAILRRKYKLAEAIRRELMYGKAKMK